MQSLNELLSTPNVHRTCAQSRETEKCNSSLRAARAELCPQATVVSHQTGGKMHLKKLELPQEADAGGRKRLKPAAS